MATAASRWGPPRPLPPPPERATAAAARDPWQGGCGVRSAGPVPTDRALGWGPRAEGEGRGVGAALTLPSPCPPPLRGPGIGSERGRYDPAPGPPPLGWRLPGKGREAGEGATRLPSPPNPKHGRGPPPAGGGGGRVGRAQPGRLAEDRPWPPRPLLGRGPAPSSTRCAPPSTRSPSFGRRGSHARGDTSLQATVDLKSREEGCPRREPYPGLWRPAPGTCPPT